MSALKASKKEGNSKGVKRLLIEVPSKVHSAFKGLVYERGQTMKESLIEYMEALIAGDRLKKSKKEKHD